MKKGLIYTIVVTYNGMKWIDLCLKSLQGQSQIIVVDNNSNDSTVSFIKEKFKEVILLEQTDNFGFGKANNIGISYAIRQGAEFVFLLNQDAYVDKDCICNLLEVSKNKKELCVLSPIHLNGTGTAMDRYFSFCANKNIHFNEESNKAALFKVPMVNAAAWFVPIRILETIGGFDPLFYHYGEDHNFCQRLDYHNFKLYIASSIYIRHDRENRLKKEIAIFTDAYYLKYEKQLKINNGDINVSQIEEVRSKQKEKYLKLIVKCVLGLKLKTVNGYLKQYKMIDPIFELILKSRETNKQQGSHYLNKSIY